MSFFSFKKKSNTEQLALDAEVAAQEAFERDKPLTNHAFESGEHPIVRIEQVNILLFVLSTSISRLDQRMS